MYYYRSIIGFAAESVNSLLLRISYSCSSCEGAFPDAAQLQPSAGNTTVLFILLSSRISADLRISAVKSPFRPAMPLSELQRVQVLLDVLLAWCYKLGQKTWL
jgi:hypothetical protein